ncbi:MAG: N-acetylmuramoyl-L-alanine amidase [Lachnospiraceae bacterium]|nr:N-acetylmuramoyl-L-alanine amidase [Lachnospiraceae bacterium]
MATKIVVDAGHNGLTDPGAVYEGRLESDDTLRLAMAIGNILARNGYDVVYTRTGDLAQSVTQKAQLANDADADLFVSLHRNMATYPGQYDGVQMLVYDLGGEKLAMAETVNKNLEALGFRNINVEARPDLAVLRRTEMPSILVEVGFIDSDKDNQLFDSRLDEIAQVIADGVMDTLDDTQVSTMQSVPGVRIAQANGLPFLRSEQTSAQDEADQTPQMMTGLPSQEKPTQAAPTETVLFSPNELEPTSPENAPQRPLYRVQVGAFYRLSNAVALEQELKRMGYNTWIVTV